MGVRQRRDGPVHAGIRQLIAFRQVLFGPGVFNGFSFCILRQVRDRRCPSVFFVQRHFRAVAQGHRQALRTDAVLVLRVVPHLDDGGFRLLRLMGVRQRRDGSVHTCIRQLIAFRQVVFGPGVFNFCSVSPVFRQVFDRDAPSVFPAACKGHWIGHFFTVQVGPDTVPVRQQGYLQGFRPFAVVVFRIVPYLPDSRFRPLRNVLHNNGYRIPFVQLNDLVCQCIARCVVVARLVGYGIPEDQSLLDLVASDRQLFCHTFGIGHHNKGIRGLCLLVGRPDCKGPETVHRGVIAGDDLFDVQRRRFPGLREERVENPVLLDVFQHRSICQLFARSVHPGIPALERITFLHRIIRNHAVAALRNCLEILPLHRIARIEIVYRLIINIIAVFIQVIDRMELTAIFVEHQIDRQIRIKGHLFIFKLLSSLGVSINIFQRAVCVGILTCFKQGNFPGVQYFPVLNIALFQNNILGHRVDHCQGMLDPDLYQDTVQGISFSGPPNLEEIHLVGRFGVNRFTQRGQDILHIRNLFPHSVFFRERIGESRYIAMLPANGVIMDLVICSVYVGFRCMVTGLPLVPIINMLLFNILQDFYSLFRQDPLTDIIVICI